MTAVAAAPCYVFGIVEGAVTAAELPPPSSARIEAVRLVHAGTLAAVVGTVAGEGSLGRSADLRAHDRTIAALLEAGVTVLPLRFGTVLTDERAVAGFLAGNAVDLARALEAVRGCVQYTVRARYEQDGILPELLARRPDIAALRRPGGAATMAEQLRLGELVARALEQQRPADAALLLDALGANLRDQRVQEPSAPDEVLHLAALVPRAESAGFEQAVEECGRKHAGRLRLRLVGPVAPYDFVPEG